MAIFRSRSEREFRLKRNSRCFRAGIQRLRLFRRNYERQVALSDFVSTDKTVCRLTNEQEEEPKCDKKG